MSRVRVPKPASAKRTMRSRSGSSAPAETDEPVPPPLPPRAVHPVLPLLPLLPLHPVLPLLPLPALLQPGQLQRRRVELDERHLAGAIAVERRDHLAQAVSHARALQTGQWDSLNKNRRAEPAYNADLIRWSANHLDQQRRGWKAFFEHHNVTPVMVDYDTLAAGPAGIAAQIIAQANVPHKPVTPVNVPLLERQADTINAEWIARSKEESGTA